MNAIINKAYYFHELYISTYEVLGTVASFLWNRAPDALPERVSGRLRYAISTIRRQGGAALRNMAQRVSRRADQTASRNEGPALLQLPKSDLFVNYGKAAMEGVGKALAGLLLSETTSPIPPSYNPAILFAGSIRLSDRRRKWFRYS